MSTATTWNDPNDCPFCGSELQNPGAGFIDHIEENPDCEAGFETWRSHITDDIWAAGPGKSELLFRCRLRRLYSLYGPYTASRDG